MQAQCFAAENLSDYVLGPGDVLSIKGSDGNVLIVPVQPDGTVVVRDVGTLAAAGQTISRLAAAINEKRKETISSPLAEVSLASRRKFVVYALGQIAHPGLYTLSEDAIKPGQYFRLSSLLEKAGGMTQSADVRYLHITRLHPKVVIDVDLWKLLFDGDIKQDVVLQSGDVVYIPTAETSTRTTNGAREVGAAGKVRVSGAVKSPGLFSVPSEGKDLLEIIAAAGGLTPDAAIRSVVIARPGDNGVIGSERVSVNAFSKHRVWAGDVVIVNVKKKIDSYLQEGTFVYSQNGYDIRPQKTPAHSQAEIEARNKHRKADIDYLCQESHRLHPSETMKSQIETAYSNFESSLQKAADELRTSEPTKSNWAAELIEYYTRPKHKWPAVSKSLDEALVARASLVQLTSERAVRNVEQRLYRFEAPIDRSHYYLSPDLRPRFRRR